MPGVPSSRGCEACRKQHKKCDQRRPSCSRCQRLKISCIGAGVQRFVFKACNNSGETGSHSQLTSHTEASSQENSKLGTISRVPSSPKCIISKLLVSNLRTQSLRYDINWAHGPFLDEVPKRIQHSEALTAATAAFMLAVPRAGVSFDLSRQRLRSYSAAMKATRLALLNPTEAYSLNTMCAVYFLWVVQSWIDIPDGMGIHPKGLAQLLNHASCFDPWDAFDRGVVYVSCSVVTSEKLLDSSLNVDANSRCWKFYNSVISQTTDIDISRSTEAQHALTQRLSKLISAIADFLLSPRSVSELWALYRVATTLVAELSQRCDQTQTGASHATPDPGNEALPETATADRRDTRCLIFSLTNALLMNAVLSVHYPDSTELATFRQQHASKVLPLSMKSGQLKPIGAGFVGVYLSHVWDTDSRKMIGGRERGSDVRDMMGSVRRRSLAFSNRLESTLQGMLEHPPIR